MESIRCGSCRALLFIVRSGGSAEIEIKCRRCRTINHIRRARPRNPSAPKRQTSARTIMAQPRRKLPGRNGFKYRPRFGVIVLCADEAEQRRIYDKLRRRHEVRVVTV
ncbi:MAG: Com family DNA-binding transcriptional regulator [Rhodospirillaceae bacterium]|nr:Com family DNA-binding transcriptional regulator [Rhodospirillaceae bacterium]